MVSMTLQMKYGSHIPILVKLLSITSRDVLEMGAGYFSTPLLHWLCISQRRRLFTYENDVTYYHQFAINNPLHKIYLVENWDEAQIEKPWDVVLIDHAPPERRKVDIIRLASWAKYIVIHDTNWRQEKHYHYKEIWHLFKYRWDYHVHCQTTVVSNFIDIKDLI